MSGGSLATSPSLLQRVLRHSTAGARIFRFLLASMSFGRTPPLVLFQGTVL